MKRRNLTVALDEETARWARVEAARRDQSVSKFVGDLLRAQMAIDTTYDEAMDAYFSVPPRALKKGPGGYPKRDELHDRAGLR